MLKNRGRRNFCNKQKTGQTTQETLIKYELDDGTIIQYKEASTSGGEAIEIHNKNPYINKTIHIK